MLNFMSRVVGRKRAVCACLEVNMLLDCAAFDMRTREGTGVI